MTAHIYVVDDTPHTLQLMTYLLQAHAHRVTGFSNAEAALAALEAGERPDLILMDLQLKGGIDGYEALSRLRSVPAPVLCPVVAVTAFAMVGDREQALRRGFAGYLSKPIDPYAFADQVDHFLPPGLAGRAPSPLMVQYDKEDALFSIEGMRAADRRIAKHYQSVGKRKNYVGEFYDGPHKFDVPMLTGVLRVRR